MTCLPRLSGGSVSNNGQTWVAESSEHSLSDDLTEVQLENLTQMKAVLLGDTALVLKRMKHLQKTEYLFSPESEATVEF